MTNVLVREPLGSWSAPRCVADVFDGGVLEITVLDTGKVLKQFRPGYWLEAQVIDEDGDLAYVLTPPRAHYFCERCRREFGYPIDGGICDVCREEHTQWAC